MIVAPTPLEGAKVIEMERLTDERGFLARSFCADELAEAGLATNICQCTVSFNAVRGTFRGLHFQAPPHAEDKYVRCTAGAIFDVILDVRRTSTTYRKWFGVELSADNHRTLFVPKGFAHGFLTLCDAAEVFYMMTEPFVPGQGRTIRWDDPDIDIALPFPPRVIARRDAEGSLLSHLEHEQ
jgi:dTDP-4-dehydrorhamnose 3,5-epimerase